MGSLVAMEMGMMANFIARLTNGPALRMLRHSLIRSEQDAVAYISQLHQTGPGLYTARRDESDRTWWSARRFPPDPCEPERGLIS